MNIEIILHLLILDKKRIKHIQLLNRQIDSTLSKGFVYRVPSSYRFSFIKSELMVDFYDCYLLMFPFLQWVTHWVSFLELNYSQNLKVQTLIQRLKNDLNDTETIYSKFKENSADRFITYLTQY